MPQSRTALPFFHLRAIVWFIRRPDLPTYDTCDESSSCDDGSGTFGGETPRDVCLRFKTKSESVDETDALDDVRPRNRKGGAAVASSTSSSSSVTAVDEASLPAPPPTPEDADAVDRRDLFDADSARVGIAGLAAAADDDLADNVDSLVVLVGELAAAGGGDGDGEGCFLFGAPGDEADMTTVATVVSFACCCCCCC